MDSYLVLVMPFVIKMKTNNKNNNGISHALLIFIERAARVHFVCMCQATQHELNQLKC